MTKPKKVLWSKEMYEYLAWRLFELMYGATEWNEAEEKQVKKYVEETRAKVDDFQRKVVDNRALRLSNEYEEHALYSLEKMYWYEIHDGEDRYLSPPIEYDPQWAQIWSDAVRKRYTIRIVYDSATSGQSERLVDPYQTSAPYGKGFCHKTKEIRTFRFDRIIDLVATNQIFTKPDNWQELARKQAQNSLEQELKRISR